MHDTWMRYKILRKDAMYTFLNAFFQRKMINNFIE